MAKRKPIPTLPNVSKELWRFLRDVDELIEYASSDAVSEKLPVRTQRRLATLAERARKRSYPLGELFFRATGLDD
jgi:hypothetical protein